MRDWHAYGRMVKFETLAFHWRKEPPAWERWNLIDWIDDRISIIIGRIEEWLRSR